MKNKNIIITIVIVVLVLAAGFWFMSSNNKNEVAGQTPIPSTNSQSTQTVKTTGPIGSLLSKGGNYTCTLNTLASDGSRVNATLYSSDGKTRFEFEAKNTEGLVTISHTIRNGSVAYSWTDGQTKGVKTAITPKSAVPVAQPTGRVIMVNETAQVESDCHPWVTDLKQFTPPAGITF